MRFCFSVVAAVVPDDCVRDRAPGSRSSPDFRSRSTSARLTAAVVRHDRCV